MTITLVSSIDIHAAPEHVWSVLTDFTAYGEWSHFRSIEGAPVEGSRLKIRMPGLSFRPFVTAAVPNEKLQWSAKIMSERIFLGQHSFGLVGNEDGTTTVINTELFSGGSVKPFGRLFAKGGKDDGYAAFNRSLKARVESLAAHQAS